MRIVATWAVIAFGSAAMAADVPQQVFHVVDFSKRPQAATIASQGVEVTLQPVPDDEPSQISVTAAIRIPGYQTVIVDEGSSYSTIERGVAIGKLSSSDPAPSILLTGFTGGAHCCATLRAIVPSAGRLKTIDFEPIDGGPDNIYPTDIDGDGTVDFIRQDDSFRYQFGSGAGSFSPPQIFNIYKGSLVDVSAEPAFRSVWESFAKTVRARCAKGDDADRNGACAAYVAAGARLGRYEAAMDEADRLAYKGKDAELPSGCKVVLVDYACPSGQEIKFYDFRSALGWFLQKQGYAG